MNKTLDRLKFWGLPASQRAALQAAQRYVERSRADSTWRAYRTDWARFQAWCERLKVSPLPASPDHVAMFLAQEADAGLSPSTIARRLSAIRLVHLGMEHPSPHDSIKVVEVMRGIRRAWGKPPEQKVPVLEADIQRMVDAVDPDTQLGLRNRALLLFGFAGAFRRSELVNLNTQDLQEEERGFLVTIRKSKTDQEARGHRIAIPRIDHSDYCPVRSLKDWLHVADIEEGRVFRRMYRGDKVAAKAMSAQSVALIIKDHAARVGFDPRHYAGHSLRSGFLTSAAARQEDLFKMADQSRHSSLETVRKYVREEDLFDRHAGANLFRDRED